MEKRDRTKCDHLAQWLDASLSFATSSDHCRPVAVPAREMLPRFRRAAHCLELLEWIWPPTDEISPADEMLRIGRFQIVRELGRGAHGIVYLAVDPMLDRQVALKVQRPESLASDELKRRFLCEAQTVAGLCHPHLVPVHEAGTIGPTLFIASDYCEGPTLSAWSRARAGDVSAQTAAEIVAALADAIQYVHEHGILHRDIKPGNVLLVPISKGAADREFPFIPKLTDFGIAKVIAATEWQTRTGAVIGTPQYMAPEQAEGRLADIGPTTDVYGLGTVLFELLVGRPPHSAESELQALQRAAEGRIDSPHKFRSDIPPDLETICQKALAPDPSSRYLTAGALADDLRRFLRREPVQARPLSSAARLGRWCRHKPLIAGLAAALLITTVSGMSAVTWSWRRAVHNQEMSEANFREAHAAVKQFLEVLDAHAASNEARFLPLKKELVTTGLGYYQRFLEQKGHDETLRGDTADALYRMAFLARAVGSENEATEALVEARNMWEQLLEESPRRTDYLRSLLKTHEHLGQAYGRLGRSADARESLQQAVALSQELIAIDPHNADYQSLVSTSNRSLSAFAAEREDWETAAVSAQKAVDAIEHALAIRPEDELYRRQFADCLSMSASVAAGRGFPQEALGHYEQAADAYQRLIEDGSGDFAASRRFARSLNATAVVLTEMGDPQEALVRLARARGILARLVQDVPVIPHARRDLAENHILASTCLVGDGQRAEREEHLRSAVRLSDGLVSENPGILQHHRLAGQAHLLLAQTLCTSSSASAREETVTTINQLLLSLDSHPDDPQCRQLLNDARQLFQLRFPNSPGDSDPYQEQH